MNRKVYDTMMLVIALAMLVMAYLTLQATVGSTAVQSNAPYSEVSD